MISQPSLTSQFLEEEEEEEEYGDNANFVYADSDDSDRDPSYSVAEETFAKLSRIQIKKSKSDCRTVEEKRPEVDGADSNESDLDFSKFDDADDKYLEKMQMIVEAGQIEKLKVDQCKMYLRKNGLRLTGKKDTLVKRIKEHIEILNAGGEKKYPISSFVLNCTGDACTGDVVMFEQNVYEMFSIASRSATGPPCGTRIVAGRIVKEGYGAAKQQHTFTVEVLWSKGTKPLPPLYPLLIKGRNLYRMKTLRQTWDNEVDRQRVLLEKHSRGSLARSDRETRVAQKEKRKMLKKHRISRKDGCDKNLGDGTSVIESHQQALLARQPSLSSSSLTAPFQENSYQNRENRSENGREQFQSQRNIYFPPLSSSFQAMHVNYRKENSYQNQENRSENGREQFQSQRYIYFRPLSSSRPFNGMPLNAMKFPLLPLPTGEPSLLQGGHMKQQSCPHYARGRCYFGENCKFSHDKTEKLATNTMMEKRGGPHIYRNPVREGYY